MMVVVVLLLLGTRSRGAAVGERELVLNGTRRYATLECSLCLCRYHRVHEIMVCFGILDRERHLLCIGKRVYTLPVSMIDRARTAVPSTNLSAGHASAVQLNSRQRTVSTPVL